MKISKRKFMLLLAKRCMTKKEVVAKGTSVGTIQNIMHGKNLQPVTVARIASILMCEVDDLLEDED